MRAFLRMLADSDYGLRAAIRLRAHGLFESRAMPRVRTVCEICSTFARTRVLAWRSLGVERVDAQNGCLHYIPSTRVD